MRSLDHGSQKALKLRVDGSFRRTARWTERSSGKQRIEAARLIFAVMMLKGDMPSKSSSCPADFGSVGSILLLDPQLVNSTCVAGIRFVQTSAYCNPLNMGLGTKESVSYSKSLGKPHDTYACNRRRECCSGVKHAGTLPCGGGSIRGSLYVPGAQAVKAWDVNIADHCCDFWQVCCLLPLGTWNWWRYQSLKM